VVESVELLEVARRVAAVGAEQLMAHAEVRNEVVATKSTGTDPVTAADLASERAVRELLAAERPEDGILGEEGDDVEGTSGLRWVVDPLDGTVSYSYGLPQWCISVACEDSERTLAGVVIDPLRREEFSAALGAGAHLNGRPLHGSGASRLDRCLLATGFGYEASRRAVQGRMVAELLPKVRDIRRLGSAALDLCWTAAGRLDAYLEHGLNHWDLAAGELICSEAGLQVLEAPGGGPLRDGRLAAPEPLVEPLLETARAALRAAGVAGDD